jgi:hypothetical protein
MVILCDCLRKQREPVVKRELLRELREEWNKKLEGHFPNLPAFESDLRKPVGDLIEQDTWVAGCISRIAKNGKLDKKLHHLLVVDQDLTDRIANTKDPRKYEFLEYKAQLDHLIRLARQILELGDD